MASGPIFLAGIDRSGIGLLGELLDAHPDVAITRRTNLWSSYAGRYGDLSDGASLDRCLADMMHDTRISRLEPDVDRLRSDFVAGRRTYAHLFELLGTQHRDRRGARRWGDKSLGAERHADTILAAYPGAAMIQVIRDPRDRHASQATHRSAGIGGVGSGTASWLWSARRARRHLTVHPGRYLAIRYEDLVTEPEATLGRVCELVEISLDPAMLAAPIGDGSPLHPGSIGRHSRDLSPAEVAFVETVAAAEMARWGYERSRPEMTGAAWARFAITGLPRAMAGLALWGPWSAVRERSGRGLPGRRTRSKV